MKIKRRVHQNAKPRVDESKEKRLEENTGISIDDVRKLDKLYLNGPASFGSEKRLQNLSKLSKKKIKMYLKTKPSLPSSKYHSRRLRLPRLKVVVDDINEIWSSIY